MKTILEFVKDDDTPILITGPKASGKSKVAATIAGRDLSKVVVNMTPAMVLSHFNEYLIDTDIVVLELESECYPRGKALKIKTFIHDVVMSDHITVTGKNKLLGNQSS